MERVEELLAMAEVLDVVKRLDVGRHPLVRERLLGDVDIALALQQVLDVNRGDLEASIEPEAATASAVRILRSPSIHFTGLRRTC
jgi:hypothetical protein